MPVSLSISNHTDRANVRYATFLGDRLWPNAVCQALNSVEFIGAVQLYRALGITQLS